MAYATSQDGTQIEYHELGDGPVIVIVNGAFSTARDSSAFAEALAGGGFRAVSYDRRARGGSGDTKPFAPEREVEDLAAVIGGVGGSVAATLGHSSGAVLALLAASGGVSTGHLFLSEPPFHYGAGLPAADLPERLQALVDAGKPGDAVTTFQLEGIGLPPAAVEQIRTSPSFESLAKLGQSTVYDAWLTRDVETPTPAMLAVTAAVTVICGDETFPLLRTASERLATEIPGAEFVFVPESRRHRLDPGATTRVVAGRLAPR